jgi:hypothetical protein
MASSATAHSRSYSSPDVKVLGCRPLANDATRFGGRRTKTSKGGNRGKGYVDGAARYTGACDRKSG